MKFHNGESGEAGCSNMSRMSATRLYAGLASYHKDARGRRDSPEQVERVTAPSTLPIGSLAFSVNIPAGKRLGEVDACLKRTRSSNSGT